MDTTYGRSEEEYNGYIFDREKDVFTKYVNSLARFIPTVPSSI